jgi:hypothetical protein
MPAFVRNKATIVLTPDPNWSWKGWNGELQINGNSSKVKVNGEHVIEETDVPNFQFTPQTYTAIGFQDIAGTIVQAIFTVSPGTASRKIRTRVGYALHASTSGTFIATVGVPSQLTTPGGLVPDPISQKRGTWRIKEPGQQIFLEQ